MASIRDLPGGRAHVSWYDETGKRHRQVLPKKEAKTLFEQVCAKSLFDKSGISPIAGTKFEAFKNLLFKDLAERYKKEHLLLGRAADNANYIYTLIEKWGSCKLPMITSEAVRPWVFSYFRQPAGKEKWAVSSVKKLVVYFKRVFNWGIEMEIIDRNPILHVVNKALKKEFKRVNKRSETISADEFWDELIVDFPKWIRSVSICGWCTGMREGEAIGLRRKAFNLISRLIRLKSDDTKEANSKSVGIEQELYDILIEIEIERPDMDPEDLVFLSSRGKPINQDYFCKKFRKCADKAGFPRLRFHDLRHCYTVRKRREGHDRSVIKAQTGHHTDSMFNWYDKVEEWELQEMAGYTHANLNILQPELQALLEKARANNIPLGAVQSLIGRMWREKAV